MRKKTNNNILKIIESIQKSLEAPPTPEKMFEEIQMMRFKIRPLQGNLSAINLKDERFIRTLWSLGKLDEYFNRVINKISKKDREIFLNFFEEIFYQYQEKLNSLDLAQKIPKQSISILEVEIYRHQDKKPN
ncbi:MAG: hypothetical protein ACPLRN_03270 [Microgenomates group bacterium]